MLFKAAVYQPQEGEGRGLAFFFCKKSAIPGGNGTLCGDIPRGGEKSLPWMGISLYVLSPQAGKFKSFYFSCDILANIDS